ncbi:unnamed protein product [Heterobilharzia americana]|nr:unnamed protein product [Heterobilharzia americana]
MNLEGAELEDEGVTGIYGSHWEARLFAGELMVSNTDVYSSVSSITLAFFEDSGWYKVKYQLAEEWDYGKRLGCDFVKKSCFEYVSKMKREGRSILPYCDNTQDIVCRDLKSYGICGVGKYTRELPQLDQFFDENAFVNKSGKYFGGTDPYQNKCPTYKSLSAIGHYQVNSFCTHEENSKESKKYENKYLQSYGESAVCVSHGGPWTYTKYPYLFTLSEDIKGSCHKYKCSKDTISIDFDGNTVKCSKGDENTRFTFKNMA